VARILCARNCFLPRYNNAAIHFQSTPAAHQKTKGALPERARKVLQRRRRGATRRGHHRRSAARRRRRLLCCANSRLGETRVHFRLARATSVIATLARAGWLVAHATQLLRAKLQRRERASNGENTPKPLMTAPLRACQMAADSARIALRHKSALHPNVDAAERQTSDESVTRRRAGRCLRRRGGAHSHAKDAFRGEPRCALSAKTALHQSRLLIITAMLDRSRPQRGRSSGRLLIIFCERHVNQKRVGHCRVASASSSARFFQPQMRRVVPRQSRAAKGEAFSLLASSGAAVVVVAVGEMH